VVLTAVPDDAAERIPLIRRHRFIVDNWSGRCPEVG
jgi:hypothetical protein